MGLTRRAGGSRMGASRQGLMRCASQSVVHYNRRDQFATSASAHRLLAGTSGMLGSLCVLADFDREANH